MKPGKMQNVPQQAQDDATAAPHAPRKLTFAENAVLTIKVLAGAALLLGAIWGINTWTAAD